MLTRPLITRLGRLSTRLLCMSTEVWAYRQDRVQDSLAGPSALSRIVRRRGRLPRGRRRLRRPGAMLGLASLPREQLRVYECGAAVLSGFGVRCGPNRPGRTKPFSDCGWLQDAVEDAVQHVSVERAAG